MNTLLNFLNARALFNRSSRTKDLQCCPLRSDHPNSLHSLRSKYKTFMLKFGLFEPWFSIGRSRLYEHIYAR